ncbi:MAG: type II secretion system F family protein [Candidatus Bathyarchaeia archaeon]
MPLLKMLEGVSFRIFGGVAPKFLSGVFEFKEHLEKAGIKIYPETYISLMFLMATLTIPVSVAALVLIYFTRILFLIFLVPMPIYVMIGFMVAPSSKAGERSSALEREMPFAATYVTVMASGGIPPYMSFKRLTDVELLPATRKESRALIRDVEIFGVDPLSALEKAAKYNPLDIFRDFISGYASTVIIGGDVIHFLETKAQEIFKAGSMKVKAAAERMGMLLESFIIVMVLMSLCFYILFSVESIYSTGMDMGSGVIMYTYVFTPLLSIVFLYLAHGMQPKSPITEYRPYKVYAVSSAIAIALLLLFTGFFGMMPVPIEAIDLPIAVAIALIVSVVPPAMVHQKIASKKSSMERGISNFLRDLTETRKTGLSPEACISNLSGRDYGAFSHELKKMSSDIGWGIPMRNVIMAFVRKTKSWMSQIVMFLLLEAVDVGGGTISMIESLARFNNMTQEIEKEKRMSVRPYMIMPYFAAILLVATTLMTLLFTTNTIAMGGETAASSADTGFLQLIFTVSVITHCYLIGLVCGKISEESLAAGFKHSAFLVFIAIVASKVVPVLLGPTT